MKTHLRTCSFCEANCGIRVGIEADRIVSIEPDEQDPLSRGHICPKAFALKHLHEDPERLRGPVRRRGDSWEELSWSDAFDLVASNIARLQRKHGRDAVALFLGNPVGQNFGTGTFSQLFAMALGTRNYFTSSSLDQNPMHAASLSLFGNVAAIPVPDIDRTQLFVVFGANPFVSNGSLMTAPGFRRRLRELRDRGGSMVVIDPRETETARAADLHLRIQPSGDPHLLGWLVHQVLTRAPHRLSDSVDRTGLPALRQAVADFAGTDALERSGVDGDQAEQLLGMLLATERTAVYGRLGLSHQAESSLATWLQLLLNIVLGTLDRPGGMMFPTPAIDLARFAKPLGRTGAKGRWRSTVRGVEEFNGELPASVFAEEVLDAGESRIRGLVTVAANPARSAPNSRRVREALQALDWFVAIDYFVNPTTRFADVILPPTTPIEQSNYPGIPYALAVRNVARYIEPGIQPPAAGKADWEILAAFQSSLLANRSRLTRGFTRGARRIMARALSPERILDPSLRVGPHRLSIAELKRHPHGIDLGPLEPRLQQVLHRRPDGVRIDDPEFIARLSELSGRLAAPGGLRLIGRRHLRSNNSWFHRWDAFDGGRDRTVAELHPDDALERGIEDGAQVTVRRGAADIVATVRITERISRGSVCLPHGWGPEDGPEDGPDAPNYNELIGTAVDPICGNAVFTGVVVEVTPIS